MSDFVAAAQDAIEQLRRRNYDPRRGVIYAHPATLRDAQSDMDYQQPFEQGSQVFGVDIETTANVPENVVLLVHLDAMRYGPDAVAFGTIGD